MASSTTPSSQADAPASALAHSSVKPVRVLACHLCQTRKIRCDRKFPCAHCVKSNSRCIPSTPAPARKRRRPNQDLQERLARCEEMLKEYGAGKPESPTPSRPSHAAVPEDLRWQPTGKIVKEDGNVRFVDSPILGDIYEQVRIMRKLMDDEESYEATPETMTPDDNSDMLLGGDSPEVNVDDLWPDPAHMFPLWQIYLDRVNPLTKIIHVPSLQPHVAAAAARAPSIPKNTEALLFSIFLMAVVALEPDECRTLLGYAREEAIQRFSSGVRLILLRVGFLRSHDMTLLQALTIYLISLQGRYDRHGVWVLNGVAIRIAQKMGLHRDGEALGLSPFECEMRRRLWWQIVMVDAKYAMFSGLSGSLLPTNCDTKSPRNVNDADIIPTSTEPILDREGPTEMIFCLLTYKFAKFLMETPGFEGAIMIPEDNPGPGLKSTPTEEQQAEYRRGVAHLHKELVEIFDRYCDAKAGVVHQVAVTMKKQILMKLEDLMTPPKQQCDWGGEVKSGADNTFKHVVTGLEHNEANYLSTKDKGFAWFSRLHFHLDIFMYLAGELCRRTEGMLVERAWRQVDVVYSFHPELFDVTNKNYRTLALHILRAWRIREHVVRTRSGGHAPEVPFYVVKLRLYMPDVDCKLEDEPTPPDPYQVPDFAAPEQFDIGGMQADDALDQFLYPLDTLSLAWDSPFPSQATNYGSGQAGSGFGPFGMGPTAEW